MWWLLKWVKNLGRLGKLVLRLAPFKFRVKHTRVTDNVVPEALSLLFDGISCEGIEPTSTSLIKSLHMVYHSLRSIRMTTDCVMISSLSMSQANLRQRSLHSIELKLLFSQERQKKEVGFPAMLRPMLLTYFNDSPLGRHLASQNTFKMWRPKFGCEI